MTIISFYFYLQFVILISYIVPLFSWSASYSFSSLRLLAATTTGRRDPSTSLKLSSGKMVDSSEERFVSQKTKDKFRNKNVLLTGSTGGLGRAFAGQLSSLGVKTLIISGRSKSSLDKVATECMKIATEETLSSSESSSSLISGGFKVHVIVCDLNDMDDVKKLGLEANKITKDIGGIDVLINNGGVSSRSRFVDTKIEVDEMVMRINYLAGASLAHDVVPNMVDNKSGTIIWISSVQGLFGLPNRSSYAASKFAVQGYCEGLRAELQSSGISVHCISPGYINTNLSRSAIKGDGQSYGKLDEATAKGADPSDVAIEVLDHVAKKDNKSSDMIVAATLSAKVAMLLRFFFPSLLQSMLVKRYEKSLLVSEDNDDTNKKLE